MNLHDFLWFLTAINSTVDGLFWLASPFSSVSIFSTWFSEHHTLCIVTPSFIKFSILEYFIDKIFTFDRIWGFTDKTTKSTFGPVLQDNTVLLIGIGPNSEVILELNVDGKLIGYGVSLCMALGSIALVEMIIHKRRMNIHAITSAMFTK